MALPLAGRVRREHEAGLVIHVGDYIYRESPCPPLNRGCADSHHGPSWKTDWQLSIRDVAGKEVMACGLTGAKLTCTPPGP